MDQPHVKNQHYVPKFLLKNFSSDKKSIWCFDRQTGSSSLRSIRSIASEQYFYDTDPGKREGSYEYLLARAESDTAPIINKILKQGSLEALESNDFAILSLFIALQLLRTKTSLNDIEASNTQLMERIKVWAKAENVSIGFQERSAREVWLSMLDSTPEFAKYIHSKIWFLIGSDNKFLLSDHPVVRHNTVNVKPNRGTLGLKSEGIEIYMPISPSLLILLLCENRFAFLEGQTFPLTAENLVHMNSLQIAYASRYIFSASNDFSLVSDIISSGAIKKRVITD